MNKYFRLDSRKLTYGEYWNITRSLTVIIPWVCKLFNVPMKFMSGLPYFESVKELEVSEEQFPERALVKLEPLFEKCLHLGFNTPRYSTYESMHRDVRTSGITLMHSSGAMIRLTHTLGLKANPPTEKVRAFLLSQLRDGTFLGTSNHRQQFLNAPGITMNRAIGAPLEKLIELHLQLLAKLPITNPVKVPATADAMDAIWDEYEKRCSDFGFQRGIYVWMTPEETAVQEQALTRAKMSAENQEDVGVLVELDKLQNQKSSWTGMIILFVVSLVLFIGAGAGRWSMNYLIILLGVLFVHEMGHYIAMRAFHYKNLKMFFIPFFGAAVSGQHYNVPGWKKVVVSLMGPVPGIVLGVIIGGAGLVMHQPILVKIALVSMLLNGFNLLPVLPLDGGWTFHALLFSRHYTLDIVFRALAAVALLASPLVLHTRVLPFVGVLMLIALPLAYRTARIAAGLKRQNFSPVSDDDQRIPPATARAIIAEIKKSSPRPQSNKTIAQQVLQIFEMLNARPPGWGATISLLFVQGASVAMALVFGLAFYVAQTGGLWSFVRAAAAQPKHSLDLKYSRTWGATASVTPDQSDIIMVATFPSATQAGMMFYSLTNRLPDNMSLTYFGDALLMAMPADQDDLRVHWFNVLTNATKDVFVDSTNYHAAFSLYCVAPDTNIAETIISEINGYFGTLPYEMLVPPWLPQDMRSPEQRTQHELARRTYLKLQDLQSPDSVELDNLENKMRTALKQGDGAGATSLQRQMNTLIETQRQQGIARLRKGENGPIDTNVIDEFVILSAPENATNGPVSAKIRKQLAQRMGQLPFRTNGVSLYDNRFSGNVGFASHAGLLITISYVSFNRIDSGPRAMALWLQGKGCIGFKYDFLQGMASEGDE